jgi:hypothetical protein
MASSLTPREEAARCRRLALAITDSSAARELMQLAEEYEAKAAVDERQAGTCEPFRIEEVDGEIAMLGPNRLAGSLAPKAALETGERLIFAARAALEADKDQAPEDISTPRPG